ncbi:MAG: choice-of-anchor E domain-containing protein [Kiritimatiellae bacterium]|nr:choice-of-anchor E domain-containing protein [Kiritimatiellia bacterium]
MTTVRRCALLVIVAVLPVAGLLHAAILPPQSFDTGTVLPGAGGTTVNFNVAKFDTSLGVLTRVTFSMTLQTWGGHYTVVNATVPSAPVTGTMGVRIDALLVGDNVPDPLGNLIDPLFAGQTTSFNLQANGDSDSLYGPDAGSPISANRSADVSSSDFYLYEGVGTYTVSFFSEEGSFHDTEGAVNGSFGAASARGLLTVTYEYEPIPEPTTMALFTLGGVVLAVRRRIVRRSRSRETVA